MADFSAPVSAASNYQYTLVTLTTHTHNTTALSSSFSFTAHTQPSRKRMVASTTQEALACFHHLNIPRVVQTSDCSMFTCTRRVLFLGNIRATNTPRDR